MARTILINMQEQNFKKIQFTVIGKDSALEGDLIFKGDTIVNGKLKGTITVLDNGKVTLERESVTEGQLYCHDIEVLGEFSGSINASGNLIVRSSGKLSGKIQAKNISIYPGAEVNMEGETQASPSA